jgi:phosphoribosylformylglycinamidine synthase
MALLDNFCWSDPVASDRNPEGSYKLAQLVRANKALYDYAVLLGTPFISGKDSMKNDYTHQEIRISVPQTVLISAVSVIGDVRRAMTMDFKEPGDVIIVVGTTYPEMGGSEYFASRGRTGNIPPRVRGTLARRTFRRIEAAISRRLVRSCHDVSDGGLGCALAECALAGGLGAEIALARVPARAIFRDDFVLFSESQSRFVVTVREGDLEALSSILRGVPYGIVGKVRNDGAFVVRGLSGATAVETDIARLKEAWQQPFRTLFD